MQQEFPPAVVRDAQLVDPGGDEGEAERYQGEVRSQFVCSGALDSAEPGADVLRLVYSHRVSLDATRAQFKNATGQKQEQSRMEGASAFPVYLSHRLD